VSFVRFVVTWYLLIDEIGENFAQAAKALKQSSTKSTKEEGHFF